MGFNKKANYSGALIIGILVIAFGAFLTVLNLFFIGEDITSPGEDNEIESIISQTEATQNESEQSLISIWREKFFGGSEAEIGGTITEKKEAIGNDQENSIFDTVNIILNIPTIVIYILFGKTAGSLSIWTGLFTTIITIFLGYLAYLAISRWLGK